MSTIVRMMMKTLTYDTDAPRKSKRQPRSKILGVVLGDEPKTTWIMFCRMNDTPIAVSNGASRGAFRSGR